MSQMKEQINAQKNKVEIWTQFRPGLSVGRLRAGEGIWKEEFWWEGA